MQFSLSQCIDAIAAVLNCEVQQALEVIDLQQTNRLLDIVYAGVSGPEHRDLVTALCAMCRVGLRSHNKFARQDREKCLAAIVMAIARHHRVDINLHPLRQTEQLLARVRDGRLDAEEMAQWLRARVVSGRPNQGLLDPVATDQPLAGCRVAYAYPVSTIATQGSQRDDAMVQDVNHEVTHLGAKVVAPERRGKDGALLSRDDAARRERGVYRLAGSNALVALTDDFSGGVGADIHSATDLGIPTVLIQREKTRSAVFDPRHVSIVSYGSRRDEAPKLVARHLVDSRWRWQSGARRSSDRELLRLRERTRLQNAWTRMSAAERRMTAQILRTSEERIGLALKTAAGLERYGSGDMQALHAALDVAPPGPLSPNPEFRAEELEALAAVVADRGIDVASAFIAAQAVQVEMSSAGHRGSLDEPLWHQYFDSLELGERNADR